MNNNRFYLRILPDYNYTISAKIDDGVVDLVKIIMLDTVLLCGNSGLDWELHKTPKFQSLGDFKRSKSYFDWLENELIEAEDYPYVIVAGHFPVWSIAEHGPTQCLVDRLRPLLHKYRVSAYMCGHDHNLQHISDNYLNHTVEYLLSGASNFVDNSTENINSIPEGSLKFHWADTTQIVNGGFGLARINQQNMTFTFYESNGKELHQTVIKPRN
jgi:tartrate-resistant acid phosphatase type 5